MKVFDPIGKGKGGVLVLGGWAKEADGGTSKAVVLSGNEAPTDSPPLAPFITNSETHCELKTII